MAKKNEKYPRLETVDVSILKAHPDGVRSAQPVDRLRLSQSLNKFGLLRPPFVLNVRTGNLIDGDQMLSPCREAGLQAVPVWLVDIDEADEDAAHLALQNHVGEWRWQQVATMLQALVARGVDVAVTGFHDSDTGPLMAADWSPAEKGPLDGSDPKQGSFL